MYFASISDVFAQRSEHEMIFKLFSVILNDQMSGSPKITKFINYSK